MMDRLEGGRGPSPLASSNLGMSDRNRQEDGSALAEHQLLDPVIAPASSSSAARAHEDAQLPATGSVKALGRDDGQIQTRISPDTGKMDAQEQLIQYRERLAKEMERREMPSRVTAANTPGVTRVSPIQEETYASFPQAPSDPSTSSTESGTTARGSMTPGPTARTPSYPFPRMTSAGFVHPPVHRPFTVLSPTGSLSASQNTSAGGTRIQEMLLSSPSTPSTVTFLPAGFAQSAEYHDFPSPNLYDLSLMLSAEPGLEAWWNTVVQILTEVYKAERVTLAVPADSTDIDNVPWGQKATYNGHREDENSLAYMGRGSSLVPSSTEDRSEDTSQTPDGRPRPESARPSLQSRHSFTSYEDKRDERQRASNRTALASSRPAAPPRSKSYLPPSAAHQSDESGYYSHVGLNQQALEEHDAEEEQTSIPSWEAPVGQRDGRGRILPVLQALDYEADPLIDHNGVARVLERGRVIALTRSYPYPDPTSTGPTTVHTTYAKTQGAENTKKRTRRPRAESSSKLSSILGTAAKLTNPASRLPKTQEGDKRKAMASAAREEDAEPRPLTPKYEEYEQAPASPWSQSPAPSPAVRADPKENPFFSDAMVDEETFNPASPPQDYSSIRPPEAIGVDNSWTVLHIPLSHPLLSKPQPTFRLDSAALEHKSASRVKNEQAPQDSGLSELSQKSPYPPGRDKQTPIAILSLLSPVIPYPSNLRQSLEHLAPHLATSFSLGRHYTSLETELNGLHRRRPNMGGFGAVDPDGRPLADPLAMVTPSYVPAGNPVSPRSTADSFTSPSDYSQPSKSAAGSPSGTPGWDPTTLGLIMENLPLATSPANVAGADSYFTTKPKTGLSMQETPAAAATVGRARRDSKEGSSMENRSWLRVFTGKVITSQDSGPMSPGAFEAHTSGGFREKGGGGSPTITISHKRRSSKESISQLPDSKDEANAEDAQSQQLDENRMKLAKQTAPIHYRHTQLHSYGADFASTFQSLPPNSIVGTRSASQSMAPSRSGSVSMGQVDMPPPSDKLKGLILDSLPAHVFVALPQTGEIVWVNSRYLTYRGQSAGDLAIDPWGSIHPSDRDEYLKAWSHSVRTGEQFSRTVRIKRFDGAYRWFYARAIASKDKRGVILQFLGSYMDIHDQHIAELKAARQEEIEASEAKHRLLANLIPQIIFTATEDEGITFANEQWLSYAGQSFEDSLGIGFMNHVHPEDLARCRIPTDTQSTPLSKVEEDQAPEELAPSTAKATAHQAEVNIRGVHQTLSRHNSSSNGSVYEMSAADLTELAKKGVVKVTTDSNGRLSYTTEVRLRARNGEYRWHLVRCVEIDNIDFGNGASSYFGSATDINDLKLLEEKLKEAMDSKSRFLSNMSHEIRTPLIGISGMVSFLQDTTLDEEQRDYTNTIQTSANSLLMIINDILDLSKVDAGMMKLNHEWFHTRSLIEDVNELVSAMAIAKRLELNYMVEEDVPAWVKGDKVRIRQVLLNVIGNAIKFTTEGEVFSRCMVVRPEGAELQDDEIMLEFSIIDTGRGFTREEGDLIFKPFSQIDGSSTRQHGGSGLGLVISRQLVELHGGRMHGTAVPGKGSTFTFTARFGLPTSRDHPDAPSSPRETPATENPQPIRQQSLTRILPGQTQYASPSTDPDLTSSALTSSGSSDPSVGSTRSQWSDRSSMSSININPGLARFSEAARASGHDLSQMRLEVPSDRSSPDTTPTPTNQAANIKPAGDFRPPMYSILVICPQTHSREATTKHIEMTLPKDIPHHITATASAADAEALIGQEDPVIFTHIVVNLPSPEEIISLMDRIMSSGVLDKTTILVLSDSVLRQAVMKLAAGTKFEDVLSESRVTYIYKPVKPSRFAVIFDPAKERDLSIDRNRSTAQRIVATQKQSYLEIAKRMGNKGYRVLLVEDNLVNQKVLRKYLKKVGVDVDITEDGVECTDKVFAQPYGYYALILCDLHMPRKDGYQACREIREWERRGDHSRMPIIALSANVMSDVVDKCIAAGFSDFVSKPVDFIKLSGALSKFF